ncbi:MAG: 1-deoxy-D-xylulose-5-phosphate reductoisomerase [Christensenellaceae bacterium]|jgi:1-deoxy-D-xylulose-5-phosphate reductoisomerase|nr:1-deoxy-D-xylulose-5-phosphate reductoisomerase [Christensenellaceae bacterium]
MTPKKRIGVLGSTGSIGRQTLAVIESAKEMFEVVFLTAGNNVDLLSQQISKFSPKRAAALCSNTVNAQIPVYDVLALSDPAFYESVDLVVNGIGGLEGLVPTISVLESSAQLATANKESFVAAGKIVRKFANKNQKKILPIDSEHSAIFQCIDGFGTEKLILTASGGAFRDLSINELKAATYKDALKHPTWQMGTKVTIDCATLMNKGFEIIEAFWLFEIDQIEVIMHRESVVHAMVLLKDGTLKMCLSRPDMRLPIQYALTYPERFECIESPDISILNSLTFSMPDRNKFPCLALGERVLKNTDLGCVLVSCDKVATDLFALGKIQFTDIPIIIERALLEFSNVSAQNVTDVLSIDREVREYTLSISKEFLLI